MASNTKNVQLGVCRVLFGGVDLGYTQGGVEVTVKTDTHKVNVDQFGKTPINEYIMGREVMVKCPLAETTLPNLVAIMPGATLTQVGGVYPLWASGAIGGLPVSAVDGFSLSYTAPGLYGTSIVTDTFLFKTTPLVDFDVAIGATLSASLANLAAAITASSSPVSAVATASALTITGDFIGPDTQAISFAKVGSGLTGTFPIAFTTPGVNPTSQNVIVPTAIGVSLLSVAKTLVLHPVSNAATDFSQDFTVYSAATAGALNFAYKLENERIYNCEFNGYPDPVTGGLFAVGDLGVQVIQVWLCLKELLY